jgi:hypothetical protein
MRSLLGHSRCNQRVAPAEVTSTTNITLGGCWDDKKGWNRIKENEIIIKVPA